MIRHLNADISCCELDGRLFFLDIQRDRYFQLAGALERSFLSYLKAPDDASVDVSELVKYNLLTGTSTRDWRSTGLDIAPPDQSLVETPCSDKRVPLDMVRDVLVIVAMMRWQLKARPLKSILQGLNEYRDTQTSPAASAEPEFQQRLSEAATAFNRVRPYIPIETRCLIDSLSMVRFLAKHGMHAHLVLGVACDPFSAHAWAQHGALVLNETVGTAQAHVPIRVI